MRSAATAKRKDSARALAPFSMALWEGGASVSVRWRRRQTSRREKGTKPAQKTETTDALGLGQGSDVLTRGLTEDVGPEGDFGRVHFLSEGDADVAKGFVSFVRACSLVWVGVVQGGRVRGYSCCR